LSVPLVKHSAHPGGPRLTRRRDKRYSRGIRQQMHRAVQELGWERKYNMKIGTPQEVPGDYSDMLSRSIFCLVMPGGWLGWAAPGGRRGAHQHQDQ
jgi:hypothetical protein